jgi:hypothetical protein
LYFVFEVLYILFFAFLLSVSDGIAPMGWTRCLIASARSVTMLANWSSSQFSFVEQGQQQEVVHAVGAVLLIFEGFLHFLFVCVASSLIIVRSLRPLQQVAFSHHCVLTDDELTLRIRILRPHSTVLIRPEIKLDVCVPSGTFVKLSIVGDGEYAKWSGNPTITIRHKVTEESPFFLRRESESESENPEKDGDPEPGQVRSTLEGVVHLAASLVATDSYGVPITEVQHYTSASSGFMAMMCKPYFDSDDGFGRVPGMSNVDAMPQILHHCKFQDQIHMGIATSDELARERLHRHTPWGWHPHGPTSNLKVRKRGASGGAAGGEAGGAGKRGEEHEVKRLVTNTDTFCRVVLVESEIGRASNSYSTAAVSKEEAMEMEKRASISSEAVNT